MQAHPIESADEHPGQDDGGIFLPFPLVLPKEEMPEIRLEPQKQRDIPALHKGCDARRKERMIEILRQLKAECAAQSPCHFRIAQQFKIQIHRKADDRQPCRQHTHLMRLPQFPEQIPEGIRQHDLLRQALNKERNAVTEVDDIALSLPEHLVKFEVVHQGPCVQHREEGQVERQFQRIRCRRVPSPVYADQIA